MTETIPTDNNAIHSATNLTPFELFSGQTKIFDRTITYNNNHDYLQKLNEYQQTLYPQIKIMLTNTAQKRKAKANTDKDEPRTVEVNDTIFRKEIDATKLHLDSQNIASRTIAM